MSLRVLLGSAAAIATLSACSGSDVSFGGSGSDTPEGTGCPSGISADSAGNCTVLNGVLTQNFTFTAANSPYTLTGPFEVGRDLGGDGLAAGGVAATLSIEPGVEIRGQNESDYFLVSRGSRILAEGTADEPIVFTSVEAATTGSDRVGQWGGLVILGQAPINGCDVTTAVQGSSGCENRIEGIEETRKYGGDQPNDNSGILSYVQVKYAGFDPDGSGSELNGISFGGVGSGTRLEYIQVHRNDDDGIEFFGGSVDASYVVISEVADDAVDLDLGYNGNIQYVLIFQRDTTGREAGDSLFEMSSEDSGVAGSNIGETNPQIANFTAIGGSGQRGWGMRMNQGMIGSFFNGVLFTSNSTGGADGTGTPCFRWESVGDDNTTYDDELDASFDSVAFSCIGDVTDSASDSDEGSLTNAQVDTLARQAINNPGAGNVGTGTSPAIAYTPGVDFDPSMADAFVNTAAETAVTAANLPSGLDSAGSGYVGAVSGPTDTWWSFACGIDSSSDPC